MTQSQLEQIKEFDKDFSIVQTLKTDLDSYNDQLNKLVSDLTSKSEECSKLNQANADLGLKLESFKKQKLQLEDQLATELDYKKMYAELKLKVDEYTSSATNKNLNVKSSSPQRAIDEQNDNIKLREMNLKVHSDLNDLKEQNYDMTKLLKKKDRQIEDLKILIEDGENLRQNFDKILKDKK